MESRTLKYKGGFGMKKRRTVVKIGGSLLKDANSIKKTALMIKKNYSEDEDLVVVVSAMKGETDRLKKTMEDNFVETYPEEMDLIMSVGEQESCALMSTALKNLGRKTKTMIAHQIPIITNSNFKEARILSIDETRIEKYLEENKIVIVAGFQGINEDLNITTLGRGGSDLTAVAIAIAIRADICILYKDAGGIYSADTKIPGIKPRLIKEISYDEMIELSSSGAKVVHSRAVIMAKIYNLKIGILPESQEKKGGTVIVKEGKICTTEKYIIESITLDTSEALFTLFDLKDKPGIAGRVFRSLAKKEINTNIIVQNINEKPTRNLSFTVPESSISKSEETLLNLINSEADFSRIKIDTEIAKVSLVGTGMISKPGIAADVFEILGQNNINIKAISTSEIKISVLIEKQHGEKAVQVLHNYFCE